VQSFKDAGQEFDEQRLREQAIETVKVSALLVDWWSSTLCTTADMLLDVCVLEFETGVGTVQATTVLEFLQKTCSVDVTPYSGSEPAPAV
jgi:hypothetical protein